MPHFGNYLKKWLKARHLSHATLAQRVGVERNTIGRWIRQETSEGVREFESLAHVMGLTTIQLDNAWQASENDALDGNVDVAPSPFHSIPTFDLAVAAGGFVNVEETAEVSSDLEKADGRFRICVRGDSMEPRWPDGCLVEFRCLRDGMHALEIGRSYYVQRGDVATFKRLEAIEDDRLTFHAINGAKYPAPIYVAREDIVRMAVAEFRLVNPDIDR